VVADGEGWEFLLTFPGLGDLGRESIFKKKKEKEVSELGKIRDGIFFPPELHSGTKITVPKTILS
jgi:hypothetical protein